MTAELISRGLTEASPKAISRRTSYLRVRLEFLRYPQVIPAFFNRRLVRSSMKFYFHFNLPMDRSPGFGSTSCNFGPLQTRFRFGSGPSVLNLAASRNSPVRSTKSTRSHSIVLSLLVSTGFQVLFHSPPGVLFTFPSRYYALSVTGSYLALGGGPPCFPQDSSCLVVLWYRLGDSTFRIRACYPLWMSFPELFSWISSSVLPAHNPTQP